MYPAVLVAAWLGLAPLPSAARAAVQQAPTPELQVAWNQCNSYEQGSRTGPAAAIAGCTVVLASSKLDDPGRAQVLEIRGWLKQNAKDFDGALDDLRQAQEYDGKRASAFAREGYVLLARDHPSDAEAATRPLARALALSPGNVEYTNFLADAQARGHVGGVDDIKFWGADALDTWRKLPEAQ